jgi:hypothetical protein
MVNVMTVHECRVDCLFPYHVIRYWVIPRPPPSVVWALSHLFKLTFWHLTWTCYWHDWISLIIITVIDLISPFCIVTRSLE